MFVVYEKTYIDRLGDIIDDELNLFDSDSVEGVYKFLQQKNVNITKRAIYYAIKNKNLIADKYSIYKLKMK